MRVCVCGVCVCIPTIPAHAFNSTFHLHVTDTSAHVGVSMLSHMNKFSVCVKIQRFGCVGG